MTTIQRSINNEDTATIVSELSAARLRKMACDLRDCAKISRWLDFAERLIHAAESLEVQAVEMEAGFSMTSRDQARLPIYY